MKQSTRRLFDKTALFTTIVCLLPILMGLAVYGELPDQVAIHWGLNNEPNGWMSKWAAVFTLPLIMAVLNLICHICGNADSKKASQPKPLLVFMKWFPAALCLILYPITLLIALGREIPISTVCCSVIGVMGLVIGNYLPKCRQNYTMGIKLPWTLNDEDNWNRTHRLAGPLYMLGGIVFLVCGFFGWVLPGFIVFLVLFLIPILYSFALSRRKGRKE